MLPKKTKKFLLLSSFCLAILCILIFSFTGIFMNGKSEKAISEIGTIYMSEMSKQMQQKFYVITDLRLFQTEGIIKRTPPDTVVYGDEMKKQLALSAEIRNFTFLGLYTEDGECETIYGEPIEFYNHEEFMETLKMEDKRIISGYDSDGKILLCLVVSEEYPMGNGKTSSALVAGLPMEDLNEALSLDGEDALFHAHVIRKDGSYVIENDEMGGYNYFTRMRESIQTIDAKKPEQYVKELRAAMEANEDYSSLVMVDGAYQHLYCSPLPGTEWYLISVMPYGVLDDAAARLGKQRQVTILTGCCAILIAVLIIFLFYYRLSQQLLKALDKAEKEAVRANRAKSEFLSSMSHDIRTPMNGIMGMTAIAMANIDDKTRVKDCLSKISLSSRHLLGLINDVLDMSKIESGKLTLNRNRLSLRETMEAIVNIIQPQVKERRQHFDIFIHNVQSEYVNCDSVRLNQILLNLLSNAVKFTPEEGSIYVYLEQEPSPKGSGYVRCHFRVKDNGIGMSEEFQQKIFETFTRDRNERVSKTEGSGLGMAITKSIVDAMEGSIVLQSAPDRGSEFHVTLDLEKVLMEEEEMKLPPWKMLVVDNNEELCESAVSSLKEIGIDADWTMDGASAVQMAEEHHRRHDDYEIVLLDWKMPGMDGLQTARELRVHLGKEIPILIISAYDWNDIEEEARQAGIQGFISKPLFKSNLYLELSKYMVKDVSDKEEEDDSTNFMGMHILLAEDNELNWEIAQDILSELGFELDWAQDGQDCVDQFKASQIGYYDAVLMDIRMPVMNGYDAARAIRMMDRPDADLPIVAMTADAFSEDIQRCMEYGMNAHISKPIDVDRLTQILEQYLGRPSGQKHSGPQEQGL